MQLSLGASRPPSCPCTHYQGPTRALSPNPKRTLAGLGDDGLCLLFRCEKALDAVLSRWHLHGCVCEERTDDAPGRTTLLPQPRWRRDDGQLRKPQRLRRNRSRVKGAESESPAARRCPMTRAGGGSLGFPQGKGIEDLFARPRAGRDRAGGPQSCMIPGRTATVPQPPGTLQARASGSVLSQSAGHHVAPQGRRMLWVQGAGGRARAAELARAWAARAGRLAWRAWIPLATPRWKRDDCTKNACICVYEKRGVSLPPLRARRMTPPNLPLLAAVRGSPPRSPGLPAQEALQARKGQGQVLPQG